MISLLLALAAQAATPTELTDIQQRDLRCAAAIAIVASEQERGVESALDYPPLAERGKRYFADVGERVMQETGMTREQVREVLEQDVEQLQREAVESADPRGTVEAVMGPCLELLEESQGDVAKPGLLECTVYLTLAYEEVESREGMSATAKDLKTLATVLESRARDEMRAEGLSGNEADERLGLTRQRIEAEAMETEGSGESSDIDFTTCFELAAP